MLLLSHHSCPVCQQGGLRWGNIFMWCSGMNNKERRTMTNGHRSSFGWHVAPETLVNKKMREGDALTHLMWTATTLCVFTIDVARVRDRGGDGERRGRVGKNRML